MTTITVNTPAQVAEPRGARWAAATFARLLKWLQTSAAQRDLQRVALSRNAEAARVRQYAQEVMAQDPRFAADLFAAADRHERGG
jgi:hypothetical protein